jgi:hypothetical protein
MLDQHLKSLHSPNQELTLEDWRRWRSDPVTIELKRDLAAAFFTQMDEDLPLNAQEAMPLVFMREGARGSVGQIFDWKPKRIAELQADDLEQGEAEDA